MPNAEKKLSRTPDAADAKIAALHKEWDDARCPICMDHPHNAVLLLCSSHDKGCRSYLCDTSYRHSNCLDRFRKMKASQDPDSSSSAVAGQEQEGVSYSPDADITLEDLQGGGSGRAESSNQLLCPLCRGAVKGWEIVRDARQYWDSKPRACSREACAFSGPYDALRRHARRVHPATRPADVDPSRRRAWRRLENQREYGDILSAVRSAMPGATLFGDYAVDSGDDVGLPRGEGGGGGSLLAAFFMFHMMSTSSSPPRSGEETTEARRQQPRPYLWGENLLGLQYDDNEEEEVRRPRSRRRLARSRSEERP